MRYPPTNECQGIAGLWHNDCWECKEDMGLWQRQTGINAVKLEALRLKWQKLEDR